MLQPTNGDANALPYSAPDGRPVHYGGVNPYRNAPGSAPRHARGTPQPGDASPRFIGQQSLSTEAPSGLADDPFRSMAHTGSRRNGRNTKRGPNQKLVINVSEAVMAGTALIVCGYFVWLVSA